MNTLGGWWIIPQTVRRARARQRQAQAHKRMKASRRLENVQAAGRFIGRLLLLLVWLTATLSGAYSREAFHFIASIEASKKPPANEDLSRVTAAKCGFCHRVAPPYLTFTHAELASSTFLPILVGQMGGIPGCASCWRRASKLSERQVA